MTTPVAVKKMEEEGLKIAAEMYKKPEEKKEEGTPVAPAPNLDAPPEDKIPPADPGKEPVVEPAIPVVDKDDKGADWKTRAEKAEHSLSVMTGKYNAEVPRLTLENKHLKGEFEGLKADFEIFKKDADSNVAAKKDAVEKQTVSDALNILDKELGDDAVEAIKNLITASIPKQDLSAVDEEIKAVKERVDGLDNSVGQFSERECQAEMTRLCPDWKKVNGSQEFKGWLKEKDDVSGYSYFDLLALAYGEKDPVKSIAIFNRFKSTLPATPKVDTVAESKRKELDALTAPSKGVSSDSTTKTEPKIYTRPEIKQFYSDLHRGKYKGKERAALAVKIEADIALATKEGRIAA